MEGNHLIDAAGTTVQLRGVNVSGLEFVPAQGWSATNPWGGQTGDATPNWATMKTWGVNSVRVPLNEASWLGLQCTDLGGVGGAVGSVRSADPGSNYKAAVQQAVDTASAAGLYVILDLHWTAPGSACPLSQNAMADTDHSLAFWSQVASTFKNRPNVIFEPFNEPFLYALTAGETAWAVLRDGGTVTQYATGGTPYTVNANWQVAGMQQMVDAIRASGATNVILTAGLDYAKDLSQWLAFKPNDPLGQLGAVWHAYPAFQTAFGTPAYVQPNYAPGIWSDVQKIVAAGYPVVITEFGDQNSPGTPSAPFASNLLPWADAQAVSYLGWTWDVWGNADDVLIKDAAGTPTDGYGVYVKQHYLCKAAGTAVCQ